MMDRVMIDDGTTSPSYDSERVLSKRAKIFQSLDYEADDGP